MVVVSSAYRSRKQNASTAVMSPLTIVCLALILAVGISADHESYDNCARIGGKCLTRAACGDGASTDQFCQDGLECCNKVPYESRCTTFGGECVKDCPKNILHLGARAKDCAAGLDCCIWLA